MTTTRTENYRFEDEFFKKVRESDVWKKLSSSEDLNWTKSLIDKYVDQWNWEDLSNNRNIPWTVSLLEKYKELIHWNHLTSTIFYCYSKRFRNNGIDTRSNEVFTELLRKFSEYWDWKFISRYAELNFTPELIESFANKWDWKELINNDEIKWNYPLFERFRLYMPLLDFENLKGSRLWESLVEVDFKIMKGRILSGQ